MATSTDSQVLRSLNINNRSDFADQFLRKETERMKMICDDINKDGIMTDYTILSIIPVIKWFLGKAKAMHDLESTGLHDIKTTPLILDSAYYMGESFVRSTKSLSWSTSNKDNTTPTVTGFKFSISMCPITDTYGIFEDILINKQSMEEVERMILMWLIKI